MTKFLIDNLCSAIAESGKCLDELELGDCATCIKNNIKNILKLEDEEINKRN